jgi:hypothetical protein
MLVFGAAGGDVVGDAAGAGEAVGSADGAGDADGAADAAGDGSGAGDGVGSGSALAPPADAVQPAISSPATANLAASGATLDLIEHQSTGLSSTSEFS